MKNLIQQEAEKLSKKYKNKKSILVPLLDFVQRQNEGFISDELVKVISKETGFSKMHVKGVISFYNMLNDSPVAKFQIEVCDLLPCNLRGSQEIFKTCQNATCSDKRFSVKKTECLGACINAPMMKINDDYHENLSPEKVLCIIDKIKQK